MKLWPWRGPEGEEDLAQYVLLLQDAAATPSRVKHYSKVGPRNTASADINNLPSTAAFFSAKTPFVLELQCKIVIYCCICT